MNMPAIIIRAIPINVIRGARPLPAHKRGRSRCIIQYGTSSIKWTMTAEKWTLLNNGDLCILILGCRAGSAANNITWRDITAKSRL